MLVKATNIGFYKWKRQIGEEFEVPDHIAKDSTWMEKVEPVVSAEPAPAPEAAKQILPS